MICTNELAALKCNKRAILEPPVVAIAPYALILLKNCGICWDMPKA